jgi:hypothetical protein
VAEEPRERPLKWKRFRVDVTRDTALRHLAFDAGRMFTAPPAAAMLLQMDLPLPDPAGLPLAPVDRCHVLLQIAAEIEHALMAQYLYAAFSLDEGIAADIAAIATEEMGHLMTVQNLLALIRRRPHLQRQDFGVNTPPEDRIFPFDLLLEPLTRTSLAKYVTAEAPQEIGAEEPLLDKIRKIAMAATGGEAVNRVGVLYALLGVIVGTDALLEAQANQPGPFQTWYQTVLELSRKPLEGGGTVGDLFGHLDDGDFDAGSEATQATKAVWNRTSTSSKASVEFRVLTATSRLGALEALADIGTQGEGPSASDPQGTHFERFFSMFKAQFGANGDGTTPFSVLTVPSGAIIPVGQEHEADPNAITHPDTVLFARLANVRYALLIGFLEQYFLQAPADRDFLVGWSFAEMFQLRKLSAELVQRQRATDPTIVAALPFTMPPAGEIGLPPGTAWSAVHATRLTEAIAIVEAIQGLALTAELQQFFAYMIDSDRRKLAEAESRRTGLTTQTRFDHVRGILDAGAGAAEPGHNGPPNRQRRFWNVPRDAFVQIKVGNKPILTPGSGAQSRLVKVLKHQEQPHMPAGRTPLTPEHIDVIEKWIDDDCPD